jgi:membrane protease YdiL (CAAX protease family)
MDNTIPTPSNSSQKLSNNIKSEVNWKQVGAFIALTFGLTWGLDLVIYLTGELNNPSVVVGLQAQMLLPAFSAMVLGMFFFKDSPIYIKSNRSTSRWFIWIFIIFTLMYLSVFIATLINPSLLLSLNTVLLLPSIIGLILLIVLRLVGGKESFSSVNMAGGQPIYWLLFGLGILVYTGLQTVLSWLFIMGNPADMAMLQAQASISGMSFPIFMVLVAVQTILLGPFLGLVVTFGEEYGWRGYLQTALMKLGKIKAIILVGAIWGVWHMPVILMGYNYPLHPVFGAFLFIPYCIGLAFILGYAVLKTKAVWLAAFLHALFNQSLSYFMGVFYTPTDTATSFGVGWPSIIVLFLLTLLILRDPIWKKSED